MSPIKKIFALGVISLLASGLVACKQKEEPVAVTPVEQHAVQPVATEEEQTQAIEEKAEETVQAIEENAEETVQAVEENAEETVQAVEKNAEETVQAVEEKAKEDVQAVEEHAAPPAEEKPAH